MYKGIERSDEAIKQSIGFIAKIVILYYSVAPFLYLLRALSGDTGITAIILRTSEPLLLIATFSVCCLQNKFKLNRYSFTLILLGIYGLFIAVFQENKIMDAMAGYSHFMTGIMLFIYFYCSGMRLNIDNFMKILSYVTLTCYSIALAAMYGLPFILGFHIYLGLACQVLIMVFFYNFQKRRVFLCILSVLLIIISGKRGVMVALFAGIIISLFFSLRHLRLKKVAKISFALILVLSLIVLVLPVTNEQLLNKYTYSEKETVDDYSAGRWNEVISAYEGWSSTIENMIIGSGFGFTYTYIHSLTKIADTEDYKNVHFSYLNPIIILGIPLALIYYICLLLLFIKIFQNVNPSFSYLKWSSLTYLIYACFVFDLFDEPIFWMINGVLFSYSDGLVSKVKLRLNSGST